MRLLLLLSLAGLVYADFLLPGESFPTGTILTIFYKYENPDNTTNPSMRFNLCDRSPGSASEDITAHLRIDCKDDCRRLVIVADTKVGIQWQVPDPWHVDLPAGPPKDGWWRLDLVKFDGDDMAVFVQGLFAGVGQFKKPLGEVNTMFYELNVVLVKVIYTPPDTGLLPFLSKAIFEIVTQSGWHPKTHIREYKKYNDFRVGRSIYITACMHIPVEGNTTRPEIMLASKDGEVFAMHTTHYESGAIRLSYQSNSTKYDNTCSFYRNIADIIHMRITRSGKTTIRVDVIEQDLVATRTCFYEDDTLSPLDSTFWVKSDHGAMVFNLQIDASNRYYMTERSA